MVELDAQAILRFIADDIENRIDNKTTFAIPQFDGPLHQTITDFFKPCEIRAIAKDCFELAGLEVQFLELMVIVLILLR